MDSKVTSILSYFGILWLVAYFAGTKDEKSIYHLKQGFGLFVVGFAFGIILRILMVISATVAGIVSLLGIVLLVLFIIGVINAVKEEQKPLPLFGKSFEKSFNFIK
ncbi:hypothetical protein RCZ04_00410 [Capnocytophaga sp. HP1101]